MLVKALADGRTSGELGEQVQRQFWATFSEIRILAPDDVQKAAVSVNDAMAALIERAKAARTGEDLKDATKRVTEALGHFADAAGVALSPQPADK